MTRAERSSTPSSASTRMLRATSLCCGTACARRAFPSPGTRIATVSSAVTTRRPGRWRKTWPAGGNPLRSHAPSKNSASLLSSPALPQAKGRVERCWGTLQDRLVKELRKAGASTVQDANRVLKAYLPRFRKRFARKPADPHSAYRPLPKELDLAGICSFHYVRRVANDNTVRLEEHLVQVPRGPAGRSYAGCQVQLQERLDGSLAILYQGRLLVRTPSVSGTTLRNRRRARGRELPAAIFPSPPQTTPRRPRNTTLASSKPSTIHPWRNSLLTKSPTG